MELEDTPATGDDCENKPPSADVPALERAPTSTVQRTEFAPADPWDGRAPYDWKHKWDKEALAAMRVEGAYLASLLLLCAASLFLLGTEKLSEPLRLDPRDSHALSVYGGAWIGGTLGGCVFAIKWYYHSIARGKWHLDRRAWRFFTPLVSGALAFATASLFIAGVLPVLDERITQSAGAIAALSFVVGYFSDNTVAALAATADRVLGTKTNLTTESDKS